VVIVTQNKQTVQFEVLTEGGRTVRCEVLTDIGQTVENRSGHSDTGHTEFSM